MSQQNDRTLAIHKLNEAWMTREQRLIDLCFDIAMRAERLTELNNEQRAEWIREQLGMLGWADAQPMGMSWAHVPKKPGHAL